MPILDCAECRYEVGAVELPARLAAKGLRAMTDGLCLDWLTNPRATSRAEARRVCLQALGTGFPRHFPLAPPGHVSGAAALSEAAA